MIRLEYLIFCTFHWQVVKINFVKFLFNVYILSALDRN